MPSGAVSRTGTNVVGRLLAHMRRNVPLMALDAALVVLAYLTMLILRFDGGLPDGYWQNFKVFLPVAVALHFTSNYLFGLYGQVWRYASIAEARRVLLAGVVAGGFLVGGDALLGWNRPRPVPLSVLVLGASLAVAAFGALRFQNRLFAFHERFLAIRRKDVVRDRRRVIVVGAGDAGAQLLRDLRTHPAIGLEPVAVLDDDPRRIGRALNEVRITGDIDSLPQIAIRVEAEEVLLAVPSATSELIRRVSSMCEEAGIGLRVLPSVREIVGRRVTARDIRDLRIEDLLGRMQVEIDLEAVSAILADRSVLITGAGGSIGSELAEQIAAFGPRRLILLDHDETHLYDAEMRLGDLEGVVPVLADIRDSDRMLGVFAQHRPDVVFHAAAHKHVPILEVHPDEAVLTNVLGTANVVDAAVAAGVQRFVLISTDKAVHPVSVMGTTKWFAEQIVRSAQGRGCSFCAVRFGNVLGSRGSVIPTFLKQIERGGPVTVTDPAMARFFMSIPEAVQLVLQATALSESGEVLTLDMGEPVNILELAKRLIRLSGRVPGVDVPIEIIGKRPGEKLVEELVDDDERSMPSSHPGIAISLPPVPDHLLLRRALRELEALALAGDIEELTGVLKTLASKRVEPMLERAAS